MVVKALSIFSAVVVSALASPTAPHTLSIDTASGGVELFRTTRGLRTIDLANDLVGETSEKYIPPPNIPTKEDITGQDVSGHGGQPFASPDLPQQQTGGVDVGNYI